MFVLLWVKYCVQYGREVLQGNAVISFVTESINSQWEVQVREPIITGKKITGTKYTGDIKKFEESTLLMIGGYIQSETLEVFGGCVVSWIIEVGLVAGRRIGST